MPVEDLDIIVDYALSRNDRRVAIFCSRHTGIPNIVNQLKHIIRRVRQIDGCVFSRFGVILPNNATIQITTRSQAEKAGRVFDKVWFDMGFLESEKVSILYRFEKKETVNDITPHDSLKIMTGESLCELIHECRSSHRIASLYFANADEINDFF